jgi:hypothetical protein
MIKRKCEMNAIFIAVLFVSMAFLPAVNAQEESLNAANTPDMVSVEQAEKVASFSIKEISGSVAGFSEWEDSAVKLSTVYYDLNGKKSAYSFNVVENEHQVGYIFVSATKDYYPVLEFSKGKIPDEIPEFTTHSKSLVQNMLTR